MYEVLVYRHQTTGPNQRQARTNKATRHADPATISLIVNKPSPDGPEGRSKRLFF